MIVLRFDFCVLSLIHVFRYILSEKRFRHFPLVNKPKKKGLFGFFKRKNKNNLAIAAQKSKSFPRFNPYRREEKKKGIPFQFKLIFLAIIILTWFAFIIYLPYFRINRITYFGLRVIKKEEIEDFIKTNYLNNWKIIPSNNYFITRTGKLAELLNKKYSLTQLTIRKKFPNDLEIDLEEKLSSIIYDNGEKYFILDSEGNAAKFLGDASLSGFCSSSTLAAAPAIATSTPEIKKAHIPEYIMLRNQYGDFPLLYDTRCLTVAEKQEKVIPKKNIEIIIAWREMIEKEGIARVRYFVTDDVLAGITMYTDKGWRVIWQPNADLNLQIKNLKTILKEEEPKEYIDLRFGERVYWK